MYNERVGGYCSTQGEPVLLSEVRPVSARLRDGCFSLAYTLGGIGMRGLVVDDSSVMRKVLTGALSRVSISDVDEAADGQEAVALVGGDNDYDVILMDWNMPNMTGIEAVRAIRGSGDKTPIIMVTTEAEKERVIEAVKSGANSYIIKPFSPQAIVAKLQEVLQLSTT